MPETHRAGNPLSKQQTFFWCDREFGQAYQVLDLHLCHERWKENRKAMLSVLEVRYNQGYAYLYSGLIESLSIAPLRAAVPEIWPL